MRIVIEGAIKPSYVKPVYFSGVHWVHCVTMDLLRVKFKTDKALKLAQQATKWELWDDLILVAKIEDSSIVVGNSHYQDWYVEED